MGPGDPRPRARRARCPTPSRSTAARWSTRSSPNPERFLPFAREGLAQAGGVLVGSHHTAASLWDALGDPDVKRRTRLGPPGVDVERFVPRERAAGRRRGSARSPAAAGRPAPSEPAPADDAFARDERAAGDALARLDPAQRPAGGVRRQADRQQGRRPAAGRLAAGARARARGAARGRRLRRLPRGLERLCAALRDGDMEQAREIALAGRSLEGPSSEAQPLRHLLAFLDGLDGDALRALSRCGGVRCWTSASC